MSSTDKRLIQFLQIARDVFVHSTTDKTLGSTYYYAKSIENLNGF